jgi:hypothetical protein
VLRSRKPATVTDPPLQREVNSAEISPEMVIYH